MRTKQPTRGRGCDELGGGELRSLSSWIRRQCSWAWCLSEVLQRFRDVRDHRMFQKCNQFFLLGRQPRDTETRESSQARPGRGSSLSIDLPPSWPVEAIHLVVIILHMPNNYMHQSVVQTHSLHYVCKRVAGPSKCNTLC